MARLKRLKGELADRYDVPGDRDLRLGSPG